MPVAEPSYRFPVQQAAFLRALKGGGYQGVARSGRGPLSVSLVSQMPPVYQQALQGTCVANAVTALLEYHDDLRTRLSVQFLFAATKEVERNGLELNFRNLRTGQPLDPGFESVFHKELAQLRMLAATNGGMAAPVVLPYLARFEEAVRERFFVSSGCLLQSCFQALETYGVCRDVLWPYAPVQAAPVFGSSAAGRVEFPPKTREDAEKRRMTYELYRLGTPNNVDEIRSFLAGANERRPMPVVVTVDFFEGCDGETYAFPETETDAEGHLVSRNAWKGRHALLIVGYMDNASYAGGGYFIIRNSLGVGWGNRGYGKLPYAYLECFALEAGTITQDRVDYEGDGYGGLRRGGGAERSPQRRSRYRWMMNMGVALALVAGTIAANVYFGERLGLHRLKPASVRSPLPPPPAEPPSGPSSGPGPASEAVPSDPPPRPPVSKPKPLVPQAIPPDSGIARDCRVLVRGRTRTAVDALLFRLLPDVSMARAVDAWGVEFSFRASTQRMRQLALALGALLKTDVYQMEHGSCIEVVGENAPMEVVIAAESLDEVRHALAQGGMAKNVKILSEKGRELTVLALDRAALLWNLRARFDVRREEDDFWVVRKARAARQADSPNN